MLTCFSMTCLFLSFVCLLALAGSIFAAPSSFAWKTASFVPPASPTITTSSPAPTNVIQARQQAVAIGYGTSQLWAKKKAPVASKKIQVKMLKHVAGTGSAGDVVLVTPAFFNNKLKPTKAAAVITDEELQAEQSEKQTQVEASNAAATRIKEQLESDDFLLIITKKSGPDGQLFGGVSPKVILEELRTKVNDDYLKDKQVKLTSVTLDGSKFRGDIKHVGDYRVTLALTNDISAKFDVSVQAE